jgi:50S ribosomal subunit-associated GTPase HflX
LFFFKFDFASNPLDLRFVLHVPIRLESADLKVAVFDVSRFPSQPLDATTVELVDDNTVVVFNKVDLLPAAADLQQQMLSALPRQPRASVLVSCETQNGFESLLNAMEGFAKSR